MDKLRKKLHENHSTENINIIRSIIFNLVDDLALEYEKRITIKTTKEHKEMIKSLEKQYSHILENEEDVGLAYIIVERLMEQIHREMVEQSAGEIHSLNEFAHKRTEEALGWMFNNSHNLQSKLNKNPS